MRTAVFYATREGQARRVAERVAADLRAHGFGVDVFDVKTTPAVDWTPYEQAFVVASVHAGRHEKEMIAFAKRWKDELERRQASFLSVTLSQAGAALLANPPETREIAGRDVQRMIAAFAAGTGWHPAHVLPVAGALRYSQYGLLFKWIMKRIAHKAGFDGPPTRDYEFTDWKAVDGFVRQTERRDRARVSAASASARAC